MDEVETLIEKLQTGSIEEKLQAAHKIGKIKDKRLVEPLIKALENENIPVLVEVVTALGKVGDERAVLPLIKALESSHYEVRIKAAEALGNIKDDRGIEPLIKALSDPYTLTEANWALVRIAEPAVKPLVEASKKLENCTLRRNISMTIRLIDMNEKRREHDFGIREMEVIPAKKIPDEFKKLMLKDGPKAMVKT